MIMPSDERHGTLLMISHHQAITRAIVDPVLCCHMASLGHNESRKTSVSWIFNIKLSDFDYPFMFQLQWWFSCGITEVRTLMSNWIQHKNYPFNYISIPSSQTYHVSKRGPCMEQSKWHELWYIWYICISCTDQMLHIMLYFLFLFLSCSSLSWPSDICVIKLCHHWFR